MTRSDKIDFYLHVSLGDFGILRPEQATGMAAGEKTLKVAKAILSNYSFPSVRVIFSSSGRLVKKSEEVLAIDAHLKQMEVRLTVDPIEGNNIQNIPPDSANRLIILGIVPNSAATDSTTSPIHLSPDVSHIAEVGSAEADDFAGVASSLRLKFAPRSTSEVSLIGKAFLAGAQEFGWYLNIQDPNQREGIYYGAAFLQVHRQVRKLKFNCTCYMDWEGRAVCGLVETKIIELAMEHPKVPVTPQIADFSGIDLLPPTILRSDVKNLLGLTGATSDEELNALIESNQLVALGKERKHITKGSLLELLGLSPR